MKNLNNENQNQDTTLKLSIIPVSTQKTPFRSWVQYQKEIAPFEEWYNHYIKDGTVGIICGKISENLEIIDIDTKNDPQGIIHKEYFKRIPEQLLKRLIIQTTPNKGMHLIYRCPDVPIDGNLKLALHSNGEVILETRGEAGYFCTSINRNRVIQGTFDLKNGDVEIPIITPEEREFLLDTARSLTRYFPSQKNTKEDGKPYQYKEPAINKFNEEFNIIDIFTQKGWTVENEDGEKVYLLRPGSSSAAHSGYYFLETKTFFCFSTSTPFSTEKPYNHFQILQVLEGNGDYRTTLNLLPKYGYELTNQGNPRQRISPDEIAEYLNKQGVRYDSFLQDITFNGEIIEEFKYNTLYIDLKKHFNQEIPRQKFEEIIKSEYIKVFNPILEFIEKNKHRRPKGMFEKWLDCMILKNSSVNTGYVLLYLKKWYVGMIAQVLDGEFANEFFLALLSLIQGIGKTTFLRRYVLPKELQKYISEHSLTFNDDFKVIMGQSLLVIDDEMDGRTYDSAQTFKNVLSNKYLTTRRKYDRRISKIKRNCSFAGSGNNLDVIRENQNRRIIPLEIESFDRYKLNKLDLTDLFIEAYHLFIDGFEYSYQPEDSNKLLNLYQDYVRKSDIEMIVDEYIDKPKNDEDGVFMSVMEIVDSLNTIYPRLSRKITVVSIGRILSEHGIKSIRKGKKKTTGYLIDKNSKIKWFPGENNILLGVPN
uniref:VapE domain-containing protein n=1 Tax=uncultured Draconibacterium sp. TaxID=1573823 RepID=UPI00321799A8